MRSIVFCVLCLQVAWGYGYPGTSRGVGAFSFSDSSGRRYGGTYDVKDGQVVSSTGNFPGGQFPTAGFPAASNFPVPFDGYQRYGFGYGFPGEFFPSYFANLDGFLHEAFDSDIENQKLAFSAARKAFDLTSYQAGGYIPNFDYRLQPFNDMPGFGEFRSMQNLPNSAFAGTAAGPGFTHQVASISPANPDMPNIDKTSRASEPPPQGGFYSVSSKSFASSSNVNGEEQTFRGAETVVNDNGKVTKYEVKS